MRNREVVVVAAGVGPALDLPPRATVVAADGGLDRAYALGLDVGVVVGDLDSVSATALGRAEAAGARIVRYPAAKDATDLELAIDEAVALGATRVVVVASEGGRLDHLLAGTLLLASDRYAGIEIDAHVGDSLVQVIRGTRTLAGTPGEPVSLLAVGGPARVTTDGLEYPLADEVLDPSSTRGVSNVLAAPSAQVTVTDGVLLAIRGGGGA